jgi:hypothetical protein
MERDIEVIRKVRTNHSITKIAGLAQRHNHVLCSGYTQPNHPHLRLARCHIMSVINIIHIQGVIHSTARRSSGFSKVPR